ncbi:MAG: tRNA-specific 2-thiouridylase, partial [Rikenellaceae bacterium]
KRVLLAYSGGIDSTAAVGILKEQGFEVSTLTLDLLPGADLAHKAEAKALKLDCAHHTKQIHDLFRDEIIDNFTNEYLTGRTPAPCTRCNPLIKWRILEDEADRLGVEHIATGHYFRISEYNNLKYVSRPADRRKDQTYYLWGLSQRTLSRAITPMADEIKSIIKADNPSQRESMGICFLSGKSYAEFITEHCGTLKPGKIVDTLGVELGNHNGIARYTIGQKRGEGIPSGFSVVEIDAEHNSVVVSDNKDDLYAMNLVIDSCNIVDINEWLASKDIEVLVRGLGRNPEGHASIERGKNRGEFIVRLSSPAWACAPGQPVVLYRGDRVIGGGYLRSAY